MALHVVKSENDGTKGTVTIRSDAEDTGVAIEELKHADARRLAIKQASRDGIGDARVGLLGAPYPIGANNKPIEAPTEQQVTHYQIDIPVTGRLV